MNKEKTIEELLSKLMHFCGLGTIILPVKPVSGGFLHRMYQVVTECGTYAVKHLNPEIMIREDAHDNYARAEKIEGILEKEGIPIVPALTIHGNKMQSIDGHFFYIFNWKKDISQTGILFQIGNVILQEIFLDKFMGSNQGMYLTSNPKSVKLIGMDIP